MAIDARFQELLADPRNHVRPPPAHVPMDKVRKAANAAMPGPARIEIAGVQALDLAIEDRAIAMRLYRPTAAADVPVILFFHGGGFVWGDLDTHDTICRLLAHASGAAVLSIDYRRAPETRFPGQIQDGLAVLRWITAEAGERGLDASRIALCGDSAGGNIACAVAMLAGENRLPLRHLAMLYPALDATCSSRSQSEFAEGHILTRAGMQWFWQCYLGEDGNAANPLASPLAASPAVLGSLPSVSLSTAEFDILRDEGEVFAARLRQAGIAVEQRRYDGMIHGFLSLTAAENVTRRALSDVAGDISRAFE